MRKIKLFTIISLLIVVFLVLKKDASASDGTVELRSTMGDNSRCYSASLLMQDGSYTVLISCRDLIYPGESGLINYAIWTQPNDGSNAVYLGLLGYGKATFRTNKPFNSLFVTIEGKVGRTPTGKTVMRGSVNPVTFLDSPTSPIPTPEGQEAASSEEPETTQPQSTKDKLFTALRRAGLAALIALVALIGLIFVVTRARG